MNFLKVVEMFRDIKILCFVLVLSTQSMLRASDLILTSEIVINDTYKIHRQNDEYVFSDGKHESAFISKNGLKAFKNKYFEFGGGPLPIAIFLNDDSSKSVDIFQGAEIIDLGDSIKIKADKKTPFFNENDYSESDVVIAFRCRQNFIYISKDFIVKINNNSYFIDSSSKDSPATRIVFISR